MSDLKRSKSKRTLINFDEASTPDGSGSENFVPDKLEEISISSPESEKV